jgi:hypothetical protein
MYESKGNVSPKKRGLHRSAGRTLQFTFTLFASDHKILGLSLLISTTCSVLWRNLMNKTGYQPMPVLLRADSGETRTSGSAIILRVVATFGTLIAFCGAVAICLIGFNAFPRKSVELKAPADAPLLPETTMSPAAAAGHDDRASVLSADSNQDHGNTVAEDRSILDQTAAPALSPASPTPPVATPAAAKTEVAASEGILPKVERPEAGRINPVSHLSEIMRKKLEKMRLTAERKRSRLEDMYRTGTISSAAYKKGEEKYQREIERYRNEMSAHIGPKNDVLGQN